MLSIDAINDSKQVVFYANLSDGREGVFRADPPSAVPAVGGPGLLALGALLLLGTVLFLKRWATDTDLSSA